MTGHAQYCVVNNIYQILKKQYFLSKKCTEKMFVAIFFAKSVWYWITATQRTRDVYNKCDLVIVSSHH